MINVTVTSQINKSFMMIPERFVFYDQQRVGMLVITFITM
jgi:hypothetical protein